MAGVILSCCCFLVTRLVPKMCPDPGQHLELLWRNQIWSTHHRLINNSANVAMVTRVASAAPSTGWHRHARVNVRNLCWAVRGSFLERTIKITVGCHRQTLRCWRTMSNSGKAGMRNPCSALSSHAAVPSFCWLLLCDTESLSESWTTEMEAVALWFNKWALLSPLHSLSALPPSDLVLGVPPQPLLLQNCFFCGIKL